MGVAAIDTRDHGFNSVVADFTVPDGCVAPPSLPTVTVAVDAPIASEAGAVSGAFRLSRSAVSSDPVTIQFSISGTALNGTDYAAVPGSATIPGGAADVVIPIVPIDDLSIEANETVTLTMRSGGPYIIGTPSSGTMTIVSDDVAPDLTVSSLTVPAQGAEGLTIQVTETTSNSGNGAAASSTTAFYLSSNSVLETGDPVVGTRTVPELGVGASSTATTSITLPSPLPPGAYTLFAKADGPGALTETNEFNNTRFWFIQIGPDLAMTVSRARTRRRRQHDHDLRHDIQPGARRGGGLDYTVLPVGGLRAGCERRPAAEPQRAGPGRRHVEQRNDKRYDSGVHRRWRLLRHRQSGRSGHRA